MNKPVSTDFRVGQVVICPTPDAFVSEVRKYLDGREGIVIEVYPVTRPNEQYCGHVNKVKVMWKRRNRRGKEKVMLMMPTHIAPAPEAA